MREIQTFVLRLIVDIEEPGTLRGSLSSVAQGDEYTFSDGAALLRLLEQLTLLNREAGQAPGAGIQSPLETFQEKGINNG